MAVLPFLETFCTVAATGSLSRAAEALHISQPAVTRQIKALEQELGAVLLTRTPRGVELTPVGHKVLEHARQALAAVTACRRAAAEAVPGAQERLRIACGAMLMQFALPPVLTAFRAERPDLDVDLRTGHFQTCVDLLLSYEVDLSVISTPMYRSGLKVTPLFRDPVMLVTAPDSPLATRSFVNLEDLRGLSLFVLPRQTGWRQQMTRVLAQADIACTLVEHPTVETIKVVVGMGMGATLLPRTAVTPDAAAKRLVAIPIRDWPEEGRIIYEIVRSEGALPSVARAFRAALRNSYAG